MSNLKELRAQLKEMGITGFHISLNPNTQATEEEVCEEALTIIKAFQRGEFEEFKFNDSPEFKPYQDY